MDKAGPLSCPLIPGTAAADTSLLVKAAMPLASTSSPDAKPSKCRRGSACMASAASAEAPRTEAPPFRYRFPLPGREATAAFPFRWTP